MFFYGYGGVSASSAGATQSTFILYALGDSKFYANVDYPKEITPFPSQIFNDATNTNTIGKTWMARLIANIQYSSLTFQLVVIPPWPWCCHYHTLDGKYVHVVDRIQNVVEVFDFDVTTW